MTFFPAGVSKSDAVRLVRLLRLQWGEQSGRCREVQRPDGRLNWVNVSSDPPDHGVPMEPEPPGRFRLIATGLPEHPIDRGLADLRRAFSQRKFGLRNGGGQVGGFDARPPVGVGVKEPRARWFSVSPLALRPEAEHCDHIWRRVTRRT